MESESLLPTALSTKLEQTLTLGRGVASRFSQRRGLARPFEGLAEELAQLCFEQGHGPVLALVRRTLGRFEVPRGTKPTRVGLVPHPLHVAMEVVAPSTTDPQYGLYLSVLRRLVHPGGADRDVEALRDAGHTWARRMSRARHPRSGAERTLAEWAAIRGIAGVELRAAEPDRLMGWPARPLSWRPPGTQQLAQVVNEVLGHIPFIEGFARVVDGGLLPAPGGGLVSLIQGEPGAGKTSLACDLAASLIASSSAVAYLSLEEQKEAVHHRIRGALQRMGISDASMELLTILEPERGPAEFDAMRLDVLFERFVHPLLAVFRDEHPDALSPFPLGFIVDSVDALDLRRGDAPTPSSRAALDALVRSLRQRGVFVVLVTGGMETDKGAGIEYLVDNVFRLGVRDDQRTIAVPKSRHQSVRGGSHGLVIRGAQGVRVYPSGQTYWKWLRSFTDVPLRRGWHVASYLQQSDRAEPLTFFEDKVPSSKVDDIPAWVITSLAPAGGHVAVLGKGSTGKSSYALKLLLSELVQVEDQEEAQPAPERGSQPVRFTVAKTKDGLPLRCALPDWPVRGIGPNSDPRARVLIVPFVYSQEWYLDAARRILLQKGFGNAGASASPTSQVEIIRLYPGSITPPILLRKLERALEQGLRDGRPFSGVLVDAVHNVPLAYPRLAEAPEVWQVLYSLLRSYGATTVSTFTAFDVGVPDPVWEEMLEPVAPAQHLSQMLTARADITVFFRQEGHRILFEMPVSGLLDFPPSVAHIWDRRRRMFGSELFVAGSGVETSL